MKCYCDAYFRPTNAVFMPTEDNYKFMGVHKFAEVSRHFAKYWPITNWASFSYDDVKMPEFSSDQIEWESHDLLNGKGTVRLDCDACRHRLICSTNHVIQVAFLPIEV